MNLPAGLRWPILTIDFEASSLEDDGYPVEVGMARWRTTASPIEVWSSTLRPHRDWLSRGRSDKSSAAVHGITRSEIDAGMTALRAVRMLDWIADEAPAFCDGGVHDAYWMTRLAKAAGRSCSFPLADWDAMMCSLPAEAQQKAERWLGRHPVPHRAGPDAERLLRALAAGLGSSPGSAPILP